VLRLLVTLSAVVAVLSVTPAHGRVADHNPVEVTDPSGDSNGAPDITGVTVANDLSGMILFVVEVANRSGFARDDDVLIYVDTDRSAATGFPERAGGGVDYLLRIDATTSQVTLGRWNGSGFEPAPGTTLQGAWANGYIAGINRAELGGTNGFAFFVRTRQQGSAGNRFDFAPTDAYFPYTLTPPHIDAIRPRFSALAPRAGSTFKVNSIQLVFETAETAVATAFTCRATLAGKRLRGTGRGACTFRLPKTAKGKRFVITITATATGGKAETFRPYAFRVR
jgi:hypothetical protein